MRQLLFTLALMIACWACGLKPTELKADALPPASEDPKVQKALVEFAAIGARDESLIGWCIFSSQVGMHDADDPTPEGRDALNKAMAEAVAVLGPSFEENWQLLGGLDYQTKAGKAYFKTIVALQEKCPRDPYASRFADRTVGEENKGTHTTMLLPDASSGLEEQPGLQGSEKTTSTPSTIAALPPDEGTSCSAAVNAAIAGKRIVFSSGSYGLAPESQDALKSIAAVAKGCSNVLIEVDGHTDNRGGRAFNKNLSEGRAMAVRDYLRAAGIPSDRLSAAGYGDERPIAPNTTRDGRRLNRRIEFVVSLASEKRNGPHPEISSSVLSEGAKLPARNTSSPPHPGNKQGSKDRATAATASAHSTADRPPRRGSQGAAKGTKSKQKTEGDLPLMFP
jgi:outer membrane protein OmpA-like peptidoglycan-associated protein